MFTFDQLNNFVVLADELNFSRAAALLNMTQPPLSRQIQKLEAELEFPLFDRTQRSVSLTPAGRAFRLEAEKILTIANASRDTARRISQGAVGVVKLGITATGIVAVLGGLLARAEESLPELTLEIQEMVSQDQISAVLKGSIDIGFAREVPRRAELESLLVRREPLVAAISRQHPLAVTRGAIRVRDLEGERVLSYSPERAHYFRVLVDTVLASVSTLPSQELTQVHSMLTLVAANKGIALVPQSTTKLRMSGVLYRPIAEHPDPIVKLRAVWRADNSNPAFRSVRALLTSLHPVIPERYETTLKSS